MRSPPHLSPTSISIWVKDPTDYYLKYLSDTPPSREPQTPAMAVGSAFDAYVKAYLFKMLFGNTNAEFESDRIFENQVEPANRDEAKRAGSICFEWYRNLGALDQLLLSLGKVIGKPRFEMDVRGKISHGRVNEVNLIPFNGKPDLFFVNEFGAHVIFDWKVNGFYSKTGHSPMPGYVKLREDGKFPKSHASAKLKEHKGIIVDESDFLENRNEDWARQLAIYSWLCGEEVGATFVAQIHQIVCRPGSIRVAEHSCFISREFQINTFNQAAEIWKVINSNWIFRHLSQEESHERCKLLDKRFEQENNIFDKLSRS